MFGVPDANETANPEVEVAVTIIEVNLMIWPVCVMTMVAVTILPAWFASPRYVPVAVQLLPSATVVGATLQLPL